MTEDREAAVRAVLDGLVDAWNTGDATAYARQFTEDADYVTFFGVNMPGRHAIEASHRALFEGPLKGSKLTGGAEPPRIRFIRSDVAVVVAGGGSTIGGDQPDPERASTLTYVLVREPDAWRITSFQNTRRTQVPGAAS